MKMITGKEKNEWAQVVNHLEAEQLKVASYDVAIIDKLPQIGNSKILDYGCGPGILARSLQSMGADVKVFDTDPEMLEKSGAKIGPNNVYTEAARIPRDAFDIITCNLVLCIVDDYEVCVISRYIRRALKKSGVAYIGFCNPLLWQTFETNLDWRFSKGRYEDNHFYWKIKKEGLYPVPEQHRPIEWYMQMFSDAGLRAEEVFFTPEYELNGVRIKDFVIFELAKGEIK